MKKYLLLFLIFIFLGCRSIIYKKEELVTYFSNDTLRILENKKGLDLALKLYEKDPNLCIILFGARDKKGNLCPIKKQKKYFNRYFNSSKKYPKKIE